MERFNIGQLTKEMVATRLKELNDPAEAAAEVLEKTLMVALKDVKSLEPAHRQVVQDACKGTMVGLVLAERNLKRGAVRILRRVHAVSDRLALDHTQMMHMALRGIAECRRFVEKQALSDVGFAIEKEFMGAGLVFNAMLYEQPARGNIRKI